MLADFQNKLPVFAAVGGFVKSSLTTRRPEGTLGSNVDDVRIAGIDEYPGYVLGALQTHILPALAAIDRLVNAVAETDAPLALVLAGADPDYVGIVGIDTHAAD